MIEPLLPPDTLRFVSNFRTVESNSEKLERLVRLAKNVLNVPVALVILRDTMGFNIVSAQGVAPQNFSSVLPPVRNTFEQEGVLEIADLTACPSSGGHFLVNGSPLRFYAGKRFNSSNSYGEGLFCILDFSPRTLTESERASLEDFAALAGSMVSGPLPVQTLPQTEKKVGNPLQLNPALLELQHELLSGEWKFDLTGQTLAHFAQKLTDADGAIIELMEGDDTLVYRYGCGVLEPISGMRVDLSSTFSSISIGTGEILLCDDASTDSRIGPECKSIMEKGSMVIVPIKLERGIVGVLKVVWLTPFAFQTSHIRILQLVVNYIAAAKRHDEEYSIKERLLMERTTMFSVLRQWQEHISAVVDNLPVILFTLDREGYLTLIEGYEIGLLPVSPDVMIGQSIYDLPAHHHTLIENFEKTLQGETTSLTLRVRTRWVFEVRMTPSRNDAGDITGCIGVAIDITQRKREQEETQFRLREALLLNQVISAASTSQELSTVLSNICEAIAVSLDLPQIAFSLLDEDKKNLTVVAEYCAPGRPPAINLTVPVAAMEIGRRVVEEKIPQTMHHVQEEHDLDYIDGIRRIRQTSSMLVVPLIIRDEVVGTLTLESLDPREFSQQEIAMVQSVASAASRAYENARLYNSIQKELAERKQVEKALEEEKERLAVTLRSIGDGVITTDISGQVLMLNRAAEEMTGWTQGYVLGMPLSAVCRILEPKSREPVPDIVCGVLEGNRPLESLVPSLLVSRAGVERYITYSAAPLHDNRRMLWGTVLVFQDVTERERMAEERLKASNLESLGLLAGGIAHDFNNILTAVMGNISLGKLGVEESSELYTVLEEAEKAAWRAKDLTQQLLTFAKGGAPVKRTAQLSDIIRETAQFILRGANVRPLFELAPDLWQVEVDRGQLSQVLQNLILNSIQAMPGGGDIILRASNESLSDDEIPLLGAGEFVRISVEDRGMGILAENMTHLFDPYFTTKEHGTGLGLAICYSIIRKHEGQIVVESEWGKGTTVNIYLPVSLEAGSPTPEKAEPAQIGLGRVLIMDDDKMVCDALTRVLKKLSYEPEVAKEGAEAIEKYIQAKNQQRPFDVVIMDLTVPGGMGGKEAIALLREIDPGIKAIVSSGYSNDPVMANYREYGFVGVMAKPYTLASLEHCLKAALNSGEPA